MPLNEGAPDHTTISRTRRLIDVETHRQVFAWVLGLLADAGLVKGKRMGIDATTLEANAALRSIVRRDNGEGYEEFLKGLAQQSGIGTATREDLGRVDRQRQQNGSNEGVERGGSEGSFGGWCRPVIGDLEGKETLVKFGERGEVVGREDLSLYDGEIDFDLIKPTGVDGSVDEDRVGPFGAEAVDSFLATMSGAVVHNPEDVASGLVGLLVHDFTDETLYWSHPILDFPAPADLR